MAITMKEIADICGVSITTVSKVINGKDHDIGEETIELVKKTVSDYGYRPNHIARSMRTKKTNTLGLIIPDIRNNFFTEIARGAEDRAEASGYNLFLANSDDELDKEIDYINSFADKEVDGIIIAGAKIRNTEKEQQMKRNIPLISIDRKTHYINNKSLISTDNLNGAYLAVDYLCKLGHNKIVHFAGPDNNEVSDKRITGYERAMKDNGLDFDSENIIHGEFSLESGFDRMMALDENKYTAIFCSNDMIAMGVLNALTVKGLKVPQDISVIGVDNIELSRMVSPSLTTMDQDTYHIGFQAVEMLISVINGEIIEETRIFDQNLIIRESTR